VKIDSPTFLTETTFISSSVVFSSGSQKFGNTDDDTHIFIGDISGSSKTTGSFGRVEIPSAYGPKAVISVQDGTDNGGLRLQGSTRVANPGSYIELMGGNYAYGSTVFNYGYAPGNSTLSFTVDGNEKIEFHGTGTITTQGNLISQELNGLISGSSTSTGSFGQIELAPGNVSINGDSNGIIVGQYGNSSKQGVFTVFGSYAGSILGLATDNNQWVFSPYDNVGLEFKGGSSGTKFKFRPGGGASKSFEITAAGDVSGSSTSTGSFGYGYIDSRLGIGTTSPERELEVVGQDAIIKIMSERHNTGTGNTNHFTTLGYDSSGARPFILSNQSNTPILFKNNAGSIPLAIHTNQYVGVNTTSPGYRLDVLHNGDDQFRVGRSAQKYVAIRDDVMQFTGMTGNGMRIQTSDNSDIKFSAGTGDIIFDYGNSGGEVISYADIRVHGDIIAENYIVSSSTTYMTTSFSAGSTAFGDTPADDTHQFTGSLNISGSSVTGYSGQPPTAILANPATSSAYGLHVRGINRGIRLDRYNSTNSSAHTNIYQNGADWTIFTQNINDPIGDPDADITKGIGVNRIGGNYYPQNNSIDFSGYDKSFSRLGVTHLTHDSNGIEITLPANKTFKVSGSLIQFTPTEKVSVTGNLELDGALTEASTMRIKTNIETLESPLDKISKLRGVSYNLKKNNEPSIGMIAEEVEEVFPELVSKDDSGKAAAMSYGRMTAVLLEAIKELKEEVDELKQENIYMKQMNRKNK